MIYPKVSIITVTFKAEQTLPQTLLSIENLEYSNLEFILIDGKSTDRTIEIADSFKQRLIDKSISVKILSEPDNGLYDAMNKGIDLSTGDYLWFLNAGDIIADKSCLNRIFSFSHKSLPDFIYGETEIIDEMGNIKGKRRLKAPEKLNWKSFKNGMLVCHQSMIVKKSVVSKFDLKYKYSSDVDWSIKCLKKSENIFNSEMIISRFLDGGVSKKRMKASLKERFIIMSEYYGLIPTLIRHFWFVIRAGFFKLIHGWI